MSPARLCVFSLTLKFKSASSCILHYAMAGHAADDRANKERVVISYLRKAVVCPQILNNDLIGTSADAVAAFKHAAKDVAPPAWAKAAPLILDVCARVHLVLEAASWQPWLDAALSDAGWRRSREVRLPQNMAMARLHMSRPVCMLPKPRPVHAADALPPGVTICPKGRQHHACST